MSYGIVFPGQGSQSIGMLHTLANEFSIVEETFGEASEILGFDLWKLVQEGTESEINQTCLTQPLILTAGVAVWRAWSHYWLGVGLADFYPLCMAGHSLGEYTALVCGGALSFKDAVRIVTLRAQYMAAALPENTGAMSAIIGLNAETLFSICEEVSTHAAQVYVCNINSSEQIVIGGHCSAVDKANVTAKKLGAKKIVPVNMSVPSHCILIKKAADKLKIVLSEVIFNTPIMPIIQNYNVDPFINLEDQLGYGVALAQNARIAENLYYQVFHPVNWVQVIFKMMSQGCKVIVELGPKKVLTTMNKRISSDIKFASIETMQDIEHAMSLIRISINSNERGAVVC